MSHRIFIGILAATLNTTQAHGVLATDLPELLSPVPLPSQVAVREGHVNVAGARLWYWDTGGDGPPVVLLHPATGSGLVWGYQQPVFAKAGYRVIGYSRKNYARSEIVDPASIAADVDDLHQLAESLELGRFHLVGLAAGGGIAMQYATAHPEKLLTMTIACSLGSVSDETYRAVSVRLRPSSFYDLPPEVRELGPCYRAANSAGVQTWMELVRQARPAGRFMPGPRATQEVTWEKLNARKIPTLLIGGDADLYTPPPLLKYFHDRLPHSKMVIIQGCGHSAYWEQPKSFNRSVIDFVGRHTD